MMKGGHEPHCTLIKTECVEQPEYALLHACHQPASQRLEALSWLTPCSETIELHPNIIGYTNESGIICDLYMCRNEYSAKMIIINHFDSS